MRSQEEQTTVGNTGWGSNVRVFDTGQMAVKERERDSYCYWMIFFAWVFS